MSKVNALWLLLLTAYLCSCSGDDYTYQPIVFPDDAEEPGNEEPAIEDGELLDLVQQQTFKYFWDFAEDKSGAAKERYHPQNPTLDQNTVATGGSGFGLMAIIVAMERNFISRQDGLARLDKILTFFESAERFHGAWPHWINGETGDVIPFSPQDNGGDLVETAFLAQGLICVYEYLKNGSTEEKDLAEKADLLWKGIEWDWYTQNQDTLYWHWSPDFNFNINLQLKGYNEVLITYVLAAASPDYGIAKEVYTQGWASDGGIRSTTETYGFPLLLSHAGSPEYGGPLFWAHYSYLGLNPNGLRDEYADYWRVNVNHTLINYNYCLENPGNFKDYGTDCWGLTASYTRTADGGIGYSAHKPGNDTGVVSPTAAISSIPYSPEESLKAMHYFYRNRERLLGPAGFYDAFSPEYDFWVADAYLAIDQGPQIIMIENYRTGLLWDLFMQNEAVQSGLDKLGFTYP
ncbi:glucoamylase family protein [Poritiphilus flavus]|uniref:Beta-glucosidase n=1 Tax=Poritiphilus flavus TaxID=2697053 RepID=A0A6L9ECZ6_9FLAO|nr:glucoamylase family protein [Poritiphilus flavus]NAS12418.1 beta-glucosidase [Poritiphilus flavus]